MGEPHTELVAVVRDLFSSAMVSLVVTLDEGEEYTWLGRGAYLDGYYEDLSPYLLAQLRAADLQYVEILDPRWGRNELLWATLNSALAERRDPSTAANGDRP